MVWAFFAGVFLGFPAGCYLREKGYVQKARAAVQIMRPDSDPFPTDNLARKTGMKKRELYYDDLKVGNAKPEDFERYIYGGNYDRKFIKDDRDVQEDKGREKFA